MIFVPRGRKFLDKHFKPLHPNISMQVLHTVFYTFPIVTVRRIWINISIWATAHLPLPLAQH